MACSKQRRALQATVSVRSGDSPSVMAPCLSGADASRRLVRRGIRQGWPTRQYTTDRQGPLVDQQDGRAGDICLEAP